MNKTYSLRPLSGVLILLILLLSCSDREENSDLVFITNTGGLYHIYECSYLGKSKIPVEMKEAWSKGYNPCTRCFPEITLRRDTILQEKKKQEETTKVSPQKREVRSERSSASQRCSGITLKGKQCKRMTRNPNGRCYQHQDD